MNEQALDLNTLFSTIRRYRRVVIAAALVGMVLGVLFLLTRPPMYSSTTAVVLPPQADSAQTGPRDMVTAARIVTSDAVLDQARRQVSPPLSREQVSRLVSASSPSQDLLQIVARGSSAEAAESLARAVADSEVEYQSDSNSTLTGSEREGLSQHRARLEDQLTAVGREMDRMKAQLAQLPPQSSQAASAQSAIAQLTAQQSPILLAINQIDAQVQAADSTPPAKIIEPATPATRPRLDTWIVISAVLGGLLGGGLAVAVVLTLARRDPRLRTRDEIADALGSPVLGSVTSHRVRSTSAWSALLESYRPGPVDAWSLRQVLDRVGAGDLLAAAGGRATEAKTTRLSLVLVLMADDPAALAVAAQLASHTATLGITTALTARQRHAMADALWATSSMRERGEQIRPGLWVGPRRRRNEADLQVELAVVDRQQPALPDLRRADAILFLVSSGLATEEDLARVAVAAYDAGGRFRGSVVVDPDALDHTTGRLLQGERVSEPPMPTKLIGVEFDSWREGDGGGS
jgi:capsular polysaccharide biosynthesis protein